jgi:hypothetical protein
MGQTQLIIPEIDEIVNFYTPKLTDFVQRESRQIYPHFLNQDNIESSIENSYNLYENENKHENTKIVMSNE